MLTQSKIIFAIFLMVITSMAFVSCKKGDDDPSLSLRSREARFVNQWTLVKYEKNGQRQDLNNATFIYDTYKEGTLKQTIEGSVFGFPTRSILNGTWAFENNEEQVRISIDSNVTTFNIQRLANSELRLKETDGADTYMYYFDGE